MTVRAVFLIALMESASISGDGITQHWRLLWIFNFNILINDESAYTMIMGCRAK